jgi:hypothetical protein
MSLAERLLHAERNQRLGHALLVEMRPEDTPRWLSDFVKPLMCLASAVEACGVCESCKLLQESPEMHPDLLILRSEGPKGFVLEDLESVYRVAYRRPSLGDRRVVWVERAERLQSGAANSLLKGIEEPRDGVHWILSSDQIHRVLGTIRSRCQHFRGAYKNPSDSGEVPDWEPEWLALKSWLEQGAPASLKFRPTPMDRADYWKDREERIQHWRLRLDQLWASLRTNWEHKPERRVLWSFQELYEFCARLESFANPSLHWSVTRKRLGWGA